MWLYNGNEFTLTTRITMFTNNPTMAAGVDVHLTSVQLGNGNGQSLDYNHFQLHELQVTHLTSRQRMSKYPLRRKISVRERFIVTSSYNLIFWIDRWTDLESNIDSLEFKMNRFNKEKKIISQMGFKRLNDSPSEF